MALPFNFVGTQFKWHGIFEARCVQNIDPLNLHRIQVRCPAIHGPGADDIASYESRSGLTLDTDYMPIPQSMAITGGAQPAGTSAPNKRVKPPNSEDPDPDTVMPWAFPCLPVLGMFNVPPVGEWVWVIFKDGNPEYPVYLGMWYALGGPQTSGQDQLTRGSTKTTSFQSINPETGEPDDTSFEIRPSPDGQSNSVTIPSAFTPASSDTLEIAPVATPYKQYKRSLPPHSNATTDPIVDSGRIQESQDDYVVQSIQKLNSGAQGFQYTYDNWSPLYSTPDAANFPNVVTSAPPEVANQAFVDPSIRTIFRSLMGHALVVGERTQNEFVQLVTAAGDILNLNAPYKRALNLDYSLRRVLGSVLNNLGNNTALYTTLAKLVNLTSATQLIGQMGQGISCTTDETNATVTVQGFGQNIQMGINHQLQDNPQGILEFSNTPQTATTTINSTNGLSVTISSTGPSLPPAPSSSQNVSNSVTIKDGLGNSFVIATSNDNSGNSAAYTITTFSGATLELSDSVSSNSTTTTFTVKTAAATLFMSDAGQGTDKLNYTGSKVSVVADSGADAVTTTTSGTSIDQTSTGPITLKTARTTFTLN